MPPGQSQQSIIQIIHRSQKNSKMMVCFSTFANPLYYTILQQVRSSVGGMLRIDDVVNPVECLSKMSSQILKILSGKLVQIPSARFAQINNPSPPLTLHTHPFHPASACHTSIPLIGSFSAHRLSHQQFSNQIIFERFTNFSNFRDLFCFE